MSAWKNRIIELLNQFNYRHMDVSLHEVMQPFSELAYKLVKDGVYSRELFSCLRKVLIAREVLVKKPTESKESTDTQRKGPANPVDLGDKE